MNAVIYARYSSDNQREESIEGQIRECTAYAERNGITVVRHYIDRALSAKTDNRPDFQQMIRDSNKKLFEIVLVWKFDRFARNRFDSANYKMILKKNNVHLISVMEPIAEGSQGILVETLLEGMAEYYSAELSEKVIRGQTENALKGKCTGGTGTIGYKIDADKFYRIDPLISPLVLEAFQRYDNGEKIVEIMNYLNEKGVRNMLGGKLTCSSMNTMLKNRRYIGELSFRDTVVPDAIPAIVPKDLFDRVQKRMEKNKRAPARGKADEEYLLTTKLFCGKCGALMFGESGTSATGRTYYYYKCATAKKKKGCNKKTVQKEWLENLVVQETMKLIQDDAVIERIVQLVMDFQNQENTAIPLLEKQLREVDRKLDNLMKAIEEGLFTRTTKERLDALEAQKDELTAKIADEKLRKPSFNADFIRFWLMKFRKFDVSQQKQRKALIEIFVNAIFLYDDRMLITFNYKDGSQTVRFEDTLAADELAGNSSDLSSSARSFLHRPVKFGTSDKFRQTDHGGPDKSLLVGKIHALCTGLMPQSLQRRNDIFEIAVYLMAALIAHFDSKCNAVQQLQRCLVFPCRVVGVALAMYRHKIHRRDGNDLRFLRRKIKFFVFLLIVKWHPSFPLPAARAVSFY